MLLNNVHYNLTDEVASNAETMSIVDEPLEPVQQGPCFPRPKTSKYVSPRSDDIDCLSSIHDGSGKSKQWQH